VSQRIEDSEERARLQAGSRRGTGRASPWAAGGYILRTAAEGAGEAERSARTCAFSSACGRGGRRAEAAFGRQLLYEDLPLQLRTVRDLARPGVGGSSSTAARTSPPCAISAASTCRRSRAGGALRGERPLFDLHGIEDDIQRALARTVQLKSGGHLVIDQTEAMTTIDVNTGSFVGRRNQEETLFKTNLEAARRSPGSCACATSAASSSSISSTCAIPSIAARCTGRWKRPWPGIRRATRSPACRSWVWWR
jgi:ribonuclease G